MRKLYRFLALLLVLLLCGCAAGAGTEPADAAEETDGTEETDGAGEAGLTVQAALTEFSAVTLDGGSFTEEDLAACDVTMVNFWTTTCGPCIREMPELAEYAAALPENVRLITVCLDGSGQEETVREILDEAGFQGITLTGGDGDFPRLCRAVQYTPTTVFLDAGGSLIGGAVIGGQSDLAGTFTAVLNQVLEFLGKDAITLDG
ncbi:MAG: TlpA family protein disulfide reductase [Oscillospiraceae bacterium]|nr:TlpA family protein disulfide reductase [Oscillospiraceae bacterium]